MFNWWKKRKINKLLVKRAGLASYLQNFPESYYCMEFGEVNEKLRQLGWTEYPLGTIKGNTVNANLDGGFTVTPPSFK